VPFKTSKTTNTYTKIQKTTTVKAKPAVVTIKTTPVIYLTLRATKEFQCR
jgi:hypothetical protein